MKYSRTIITTIIAVLAVALLAAGPVSAASHGRAAHHKQRHHRAPITKTQTVPAGIPTADPGTPPETPSSVANAPLRGGLLPLPVEGGGRAVAMQTGSWQQGDDPDGSCQTDVDNANQWQEKGDYLSSKGDQAGADKAYDIASSLAGEANAGGCTIFLVDD